MLSIKKKRKKLNLTQKMLADKLGITREYISLLENGHCDPSMKLLKQIAVELGTTVNDLVSEDLS